MGMLDNLLLKEKLSQRSFEIEASLYEKVLELSKEKIDASASKIINYCIYELAEKDHVNMEEMKDLEKHTVIIRKTALDELNRMKKKYNIPIYVLINIAIRDGIEKLEKRK